MTAVEFLEEKLLELFENHLPFELLEEAKEMEKKQIIDAYWEGCSTWDNDKDAEQYYNETFNK
jgi:hypothetical protein